MEYRRRHRVRTRRTNQNRSSGFGGFIFLLVLIVGAVYLLSASAAGTWLAQKVIAPVFSAFSNDKNPQTLTGDASIFTTVSSGKNSITKDMKIPQMYAYLLQMGIYESQENASSAASALNVKGAGGYIIQENGRYRVFASGYLNKDEAKNVQDRLNKEGLEATVYVLSAEALTFKVTLDAAKQDQSSMFQVAFDAMANAETKITELAINFDKNAMTVADGISNAKLIENTLKSEFAILSEQTASNEVLTQIVTCYNSYVKCIDDLIAYDANAQKNTVDFSAKVKYTQLQMAHEYVKLLNALAQ